MIGSWELVKGLRRSTLTHSEPVRLVLTFDIISLGNVQIYTQKLLTNVIYVCMYVCMYVGMYVCMHA